MALWKWAFSLTLALIPFSISARADERLDDFQAQLIRVSELNTDPAGQALGPAFVPAGSDPLGEGSVGLNGDRKVEVRLRGAAPSKEYSMHFCRFGFGPAGCVPLSTAGALTTDADGNGRVRVDFPQPPTGSNAWAGAFVLARNISGQQTYEFMSGFRLRPAPDEAAEIQIEGFLSSINTPARSFRVGNLPQDIFVDNATEFRGEARAFSDLAVGKFAEIKARVSNDGKVTAREVELKGQGFEPPRGRGHRRD